MCPECKGKCKECEVVIMQPEVLGGNPEPFETYRCNKIYRKFVLERNLMVACSCDPQMVEGCPLR